MDSPQSSLESPDSLSRNVGELILGLLKGLTTSDAAQAEPLVREPPENPELLCGVPMDPKLLVAATSGDVACIRKLVEEDPNVAFNLTRFPNLYLHPELRKATTSGDVTRICQLVQEDPKLLFGIINQLIPFMDTKLKKAVTMGDVAQVKRLVREKPELLSRLRCQDYTPMDPRMLEAAAKGNTACLSELAEEHPDLLDGVTPTKNTALHIAVLSGHRGFVVEFCTMKLRLLNSSRLPAKRNSIGETPLHLAAISGNRSILSFLLGRLHEEFDQAKGAVMVANDKGDTALHLALEYGHTEMAVELLRAEPQVSQIVNKSGESTLFMAVSRGFHEIAKELLKSPWCHLGGPDGWTALHAAAAREEPDIARTLLEERPLITRARTGKGYNALHIAAGAGRLKMVQLLLNHDISLAYGLEEHYWSPFLFAVLSSHIHIMKELSERCPDSVTIMDNSGLNILHMAIALGMSNVVENILNTPVFQGLKNQRNKDGLTPLHLAACKSDPKILHILLKDKRVNPEAYALNGHNAWNFFYSNMVESGTLQWNETFQLLDKVVPRSVMGIQDITKRELTEKETKEIKSLTQTYTNNTTVVATLMATVTFAAAFTVPGGYKTDNGPDEGKAALAKKAAFQVFLVSNTIAMCSSLAVAFLFILMTREDMEYLLHYKTSTQKLMWCAYIGLVVAFATGVYVVVAPDTLWIAIFICVLSCILPFLTRILARWPVYTLRFRLRNPWLKLIERL